MFTSIEKYYEQFLIYCLPVQPDHWSVSLGVSADKVVFECASSFCPDGPRSPGACGPQADEGCDRPGAAGGVGGLRPLPQDEQQPR